MTLKSYHLSFNGKEIFVSSILDLFLKVSIFYFYFFSFFFCFVLKGLYYLLLSL